MDAIWKLTWALPLVLLTGLVVVLLLKRVMNVPAAEGSVQRLRNRESLTLSGHTRLHLVEVDGKPLLLIESDRATQLQALEAGGPQT